MNGLIGKIGVTITAFLMLGLFFILDTNIYAVKPDDYKYYFEDRINTGKDNGYSEEHIIDEKDPHYGWNIGKFYVSGYTADTKDNNDNPVFIKNDGDDVILWFKLDQDIDSLNGNKKMKISQDKNGFDTYFGIDERDFGRGTLIIKHIDYQHLGRDPIIHHNYLAVDMSRGKDTQVQICEEGDYEVALDYEIQKDAWQPWGKSWFPSYHNYRMFFKFSVRNGNCMVFPKDVSTGSDLNNTSMTKYGFTLDLAKTRYLDINIKREVLREGAHGLSEDVRFNRPAKDGARYTLEGIYTITARNKYTNQVTEKKIYVGQDDVLKAYIRTGLPIEKIEKMLDMGATINDDGTINDPPLPPETSATEVTEITTVSKETETTTTEATVITTTATTTEITTTETSEVIPVDSDETKNKSSLLLIICIILLVIILLVAAVYFTHLYDKNEELKRKETGSSSNKEE